jgi:YaiO family outer membrane protein
MNHINNEKNMHQKILTHLFILAGLIFLLGLLTGKSYGQTFDEARKLALNGERAKARQICRTILSKGFDSDVALLLARTFAWDGKYDSTRVILNQVLDKNPDNMEALDAFADVEYWADNYEKAISYCNLALKKDSTAEAFVFKKARILNSAQRYSEAYNLMEELLRKNPSNPEALKKLKDYRLNNLKNAIKLSYTIDYFDNAFNRDPWQITSLSYGRKTKYGSVIARVNLANRFNSNGIQYELDAYPKISENNYGYLNYGFSQSAVFPEHRIGLEWYHNFPKSYEGSFGIRKLFFNSSDVTIFTATFGKYIGNYWISFRSFVTPVDDKTSVSGLLQIRRYFSDPENYIGLRLGYGISPDDNRNLIDTGKNLTYTRSIRVEFNHIFSRAWILNSGAVLGQEERIVNSFSGYYTFDISISRLF